MPMCLIRLRLLFSRGKAFPSANALKQQGYNASTGVLSVNYNNSGKSTVTSSGGKITGTQAATVTATGKYGERATGTTTMSQTVNSGKLATATGSLLGLGAFGSALNSGGADLGAKLSAGDYWGAYKSWANIAYNTINNLTGGLPSGLGQIIDGFNATHAAGDMTAQANALAKQAAAAAEAQKQAMQKGDIGGAIGAAAAAKSANELAKQASSNNTNNFETGYLYVTVTVTTYDGGGGNNLPSVKSTGHLVKTLSGKTLSGQSVKIFNSSRPSLTVPDTDFVVPLHQFGVSPVFYTTVTYRPASKQDFYDLWQSPSTLANIQLTASDIEHILLDMLNNQKANHKEMMDALAKIAANSGNNDLISDATEAASVAQTTILSEPYTPLGSNTAQQTQFTVNADGSVTSTVIPRPDLTANSSLAPTRQEVGTNTTGQIGQSQTDSQTQPNQDFCKANPTSAQCASLGNIDYQDLLIPTNQIDLDFKPSDIFVTNGICPQPKTFDLSILGTFEIGYDMACNVASKIRPILILIVMLACMHFAYSSVREI